MNNDDKTIKKPNDFGITDQNYLMLKHIQNGKTVKDAYKLAGYEGKDSNAPYQLYHRLKKKLELVYDADNVDSLRLKIMAKQIADMPIKETEIKAETKLKAIETLHKLQSKEAEEKKTISPFIVFKESDGKIQASQGKVVQAEVVDVQTKQNNEEE